MEYLEKDMTAYKVHLIKTDKFKTITIRVLFRNEINKDEITLRNMLVSFLNYSNDLYRTKRDVVLKSEDLYAATVYSKAYRSGRYDMISFYLTLLSEKYTEPGMLEESIKYFSTFLFNPNFNDDSKYNDAFNYLYDGLEKNLKGLKENGDGYSTVRMLEEMDSNMPYGYRDVGYLEDLKNITKDKLISYYDKLINNSLVDIYIIGNIDNSIIKIIDKYFLFKTFKRPKQKQIITHDKLPNKSKTIKEENDSNQSKLSIGCKIDKLSEFERNYVLTIYNMILGNGSESKFFQIIREKHSLAYYVYSSLNKLDSLMIIRAGIAKENFDKTVKLVRKLMKDITLGKFSIDDINIAKESYISMLNEIEDNDNAIIETYLAKEILNLGDIEERKCEVMKVTKQDIVNISKKIKIDTIFLLEGVLEDE